jgi:hypothetical protein
MKNYTYIQITIILITSYFLLFGQTSAAIINIPADYPTIQQGIDASSDGDTVLVQPGTYYENINFNGHNIVLGSLFLTTGDTSYLEQTAIDGGNNASAVIFSNNEDSMAIISGFSIRHGLAVQNAGGGIHCSNADPRIINNIIEDNLGDAGGGIYCQNSDAVIAHNIIRGNNIISPIGNPGGGICCKENSRCVIMFNIIYGNINQDGAGIATVESSPLIINNLIYGNTAIDLGGAIRSDYSSPIIINNTIAYNSATTGGGIFLLFSPDAVITSSIFWGDSAGTSDEIHEENGVATVFYCDIEGGWPGLGNIDAAPLFRDPDNGDYHLMSTACGDSLDSPCIDAGNPAYMDEILDCSRGLGLAFSDMGAYGGIDSCTLGINNGGASGPYRLILARNYPNPFNASTTIEFTLPEAAEVQLSIYNILGQKVAVIFAGIKQAGAHSVTWDAGDSPSGVYFARLESGDQARAIKMVLLR